MAKAKTKAKTRKIKVTQLPVFDMVNYLQDEKAIAEYLTVVMEENDPAALVQALGTVARVCTALGVKLVAQPIRG